MATAPAQTAPNPGAIVAALAAYRSAVRHAQYWEDHGTHGDSHKEDARRAELVARKSLLALVGVNA